jgi:hypothetical protein
VLYCSDRNICLCVAIRPNICLRRRLVDLQELLELRVLFLFNLFSFPLQGILLQWRYVFVVCGRALFEPLLPSRLGEFLVGYLRVLRRHFRQPWW